jgi:hypothetical protein
MVNLSARVVDNIQLSIKNIHIRFEDTHLFREPISMGLTLQELSVDTTNESWQKEFIDRTVEANKQKPLNKLLSLRNFGFYCSPNDDLNNLVLQLESPEERYLKFANLFDEGAESSSIYKRHYILEPISIVAKLKQLKERRQPALAPNEDQIEQLRPEPKYSVDFEVDHFQVSFKKTQFESVLKFLQIVNDFQMEQDGMLHQLREAHLRAGHPEEYSALRSTFLAALRKKLLVQSKLAANNEIKPTKQQLEAAERESPVNVEEQKAYDLFVEYESMPLLKRWAEQELSSQRE